MAVRDNASTLTPAFPHPNAVAQSLTSCHQVKLFEAGVCESEGGHAVLSSQNVKGHEVAMQLATGLS